MRSCINCFVAAVLAASCCLAQTARPGRSRWWKAAASCSVPAGRAELAIGSQDRRCRGALASRTSWSTAKIPGHTTLVIWESGSDRRAMKSRSPRTTPTGTASAKLIEDNANGGAVTGHRPPGETIVAGRFRQERGRFQASGGLAQTRAKTVINLLKAPPPPDPRQILLQVKFAAVNRVR